VVSMADGPGEVTSGEPPCTGNVVTELECHSASAGPFILYNRSVRTILLQIARVGSDHQSKWRSQPVD